MADLTGLSAAQRRAVRAPADRPLLIEACPGAGKTRILTHRAAWLVEAGGLAPDELLLLAFANRDVADMEAQLAPLLGHRAGRVAVTTVHAFGHRLARHFALASGGLDFDQMLAIPLAALRAGHPMGAVLRRAIRHVLVDEGQDLAAPAAELVRWLADGDGRLTVVGDPDQRVYGGLGALGLGWFAAAYPDARRLRLDDNYRSAAGVVAVANAVMGRAARPQRPAGPPPALVRARDEWAEADFIAGEVVRLRRAGAIRAADAAAVLVRAAWQAAPIMEALGRRGVPCVAGVDASPDRGPAAPGALVTTIHKSKGGEWEVVFIPGLDEGTLPWRAPSTRRGWRPPAEREDERLAGERRLLYVAVSRAIERLYLSYPATRRQGDRVVTTERSRFLDRLPPGLVAPRADRRTGGDRRA